MEIVDGILNLFEDTNINVIFYYYNCTEKKNDVWVLKSY